MTKKVVTTSEATETTEYILNGKNVAELIKTTVTTGASPTTTTDRQHFYYDTQGRVALVDFNGIKYSYVHNLQGDVIGILDSSGNLVVEYRYDAWGKPISAAGTLTTTLGELNPFRYRGYVWDQETGLYYLRSRYYCLQAMRFLSTDTLIDGNLYRYCQSNPINRIDPTGKISDKMYIFAHYGAQKEQTYDFTDPSFPDKELAADITHALQHSNVLWNVVKRTTGSFSVTDTVVMETKIKKSDYGSFTDMNLYDMDLYLSVRRATFQFTISTDIGENPTALILQQEYGYTCYKFEFTLSDKYDFDSLMDNENESRIVAAINDILGYIPQEIGLLNKYRWTTKGTFYYCIDSLGPIFF